MGGGGSAPKRRQCQEQGQEPRERRRNRGQARGQVWPPTGLLLRRRPLSRLVARRRSPTRLYHCSQPINIKKIIASNFYFRKPFGRNLGEMLAGSSRILAESGVSHKSLPTKNSWFCARIITDLVEEDFCDTPNIISRTWRHNIQKRNYAKE